MGLPVSFARVAICALASFACIAGAAAQERQRAAAIDYAFVGRPGWLPDAVAAPDGVELRFLAISTIDGFRVDAALWQPKGRAPESLPLIINVHGSGGNFHSSGVAGIAGPGLAAQGYASLSINTRQHDGYIYTDNFFDIRKDIDAAVWTARALHFPAIVLQGFSLGNIQVQYYAASDWSPDLKGVVLTGTFANLPRKTRQVINRDEENYRALFDAAQDQLRGGRQADKMPVEMLWRGRKSMPMSGQHFLTYRWDGTGVADGTFWIKRIPRPILIVRDEGDAIVAAEQPVELLAAARAPDSIVPSVRFVSLPNPKGANPTGHAFADNRDKLIETITGWLKEQGLQPAAPVVASEHGIAPPVETSAAAQVNKAR